MKKMIFLMLTLLIWGVVSMNAQVRIGGSDEPYGATILDLNVNDDATPAGNLGLSLPRVNLTIPAQTLGGETPKDGTVVYNTGAGLQGAGVYVWASTQWVKVAAGSVAAPIITTQPKAFSFSRLQDTNGDPNGPATATIADLTVVASGSNLTYKWYKKATNHNVADTEVATTATYTPTVTAWGMTSYYVVVSNEFGSVTSQVAEVAIGCGAKTATGGWLKFMCYNLGSVDTQLEPFTFASGNLGAFHQWGRPDAAERTNTATNWTNATVYPNDWTIPTGYTAAAPETNTNHQDDYLWRNHKNGASDPCPAGWHVPSQTAFGAIFKGTADADVPANATANTWTATGTFADVSGTGGYAVKPDGATTTLFFPAAGYRYYSNGALSYVGLLGNYWSSTPAGTGAYSLYILSGRVYPSAIYRRGRGFSVRCISE